jgi:hypothetical protein
MKELEPGVRFVGSTEGGDSRGLRVEHTSEFALAPGFFLALRNCPALGLPLDMPVFLQ